MRVLLFCPTVKLSRDTFESIHGLKFDGTLDTLFAHDNPHGDGAAQNIIYNYRKAERIVKAEDYTHLLTVEDDMLIQPDALQKMSAVDADIVYGVYCFRKGGPFLNISRPDDLMESYSLPHNLKAWRKLFGSVIECSGLGFGCTLIRRSVFDVLEFRSGPGHDGDTQMALDAMRLGLKQMSDTSVLCGHRRADGTTVWPTRTGADIYGTSVPLPVRKVRALQPTSFWTFDEVPVVMQPGNEYEIDDEHAAAYVETGRAEYVQ